jgi:cellulose synthase/poly-beta-1,6-N-acetylglucosamine synthase-like glycosyltransferase
MTEIRTVTTLKRKRAEISASIKLYERQLAQARLDLAHIAAAIRIFDASGKPSDIARYVDTYRLFKRGDPYNVTEDADLGVRLYRLGYRSAALSSAT